MEPSFTFSNITDEDALKIIKKYPDVSGLHIQNNKTSDPIFLYNFNLTSKGIIECIRNCRQLKKLNLSWSKDLSDQDFKTIFTIFTIFTVIETIHIPGTCVSDETLKIISNHCLKLKYIDLSLCQYITYEGVSSLFKLKNLREIKTNNCCHIIERF